MSTILRQSFSLNLAAADAIANAAINAVSDLKTHKPMCVTVLDGNGSILVQKRMDGCPDGAYIKFSYAKARTCIHLQTSSRSFREKYTGSGEAPKVTQAGAMVSVMQGELIPVAGGVLIQSEGMLLGYVRKILLPLPFHYLRSLILLIVMLLSLMNQDGHTVGAVGV